MARRKRPAAQDVVQVWTNSPRLEKAIVDALAPIDVQCHRVTGVDQHPSKVDAVITTGRLTREAELLALHHGVGPPIVLPEAEEWLKAKVESGWRRLVGSDLSKPNTWVSAATRAA